MDKQEYRMKTEQMLGHMREQSYGEALAIADTIDWKRVKNVPMLCAVSEIYEMNGEYQKARDILFLAYDRSPESKKIIYRLGILALKLDEVKEAMDCYEEFIAIAPKDPNRYVLKYKILKAQKAPIQDQIEVLETFKKVEYVEKWAFELAKLYQAAGMTVECTEECDDLILWFSEGKYVYKAMELKMQYKPLTPLQREKYNHRFEQEEKPAEKKEENSVASQQKVEEDVVEETIEKAEEEQDEEKKEGPTRSITEMLEGWEEIQKENAELIRAEKEKAEQEQAELVKAQEAKAEEEEKEPEELLTDDIRQLMEALEGESQDYEAQKMKQEEETEVEKPAEKPLVQKVVEQLATIPSIVAGETVAAGTEVLAEETVRVAEEDTETQESGGIRLGDTQSMAAVAKALKNNVEVEIVEEESEDFSEEDSQDTGFIVHGRYDLEAQSEIGLKAGLTEEQKKLFSYFVPVHGMSEQIVEVLHNDQACNARYGTSRTGNIVIIGRKGSGKTVLAVNIVKAIQKARKVKAGKVGIVAAEALNKKDINNILAKLRGGALIIEKASRLNRKSIETLCEAMEGKTGEMLVVMEDERKPMETMLAAFPQFEKKFTSRLELPVFISDELVTFGQTYAKENGYKIDEMGILALYSRIDILQREEKAVTVADVKSIVDDAIENSQKVTFKKLVKKLLGKSTDDSDRILLTEDDF